MSALLALANPRHIKASHRRRRRCTTGHRQYANNNPYTFNDPDGEIANFLVGAVIGAVADIAIQTALFATGAQDSFSVSSVLISAASGAVGVGIAAKASQLGKIAGTLTNIGGDAAVSATSSALKGDDVTFGGVAKDVLLGQAAGAAAGKAVGDSIVSSPANKLSAKQVDRAERIAKNPKVGRPETRARQAAQAEARHSTNVAEQQANAGAVGSNAAQGVEKVREENN